MKEKLVSFDTAKLAKEKGLQIGVRTSYCEYHSEYVYDSDPEHPESHKKNEVRLDRDFYTVNSYKNIDMSNKHYTIYEAPTQSLLETWLFEKHNIHVEITFDDGTWIGYIGEFSFPDSSVEPIVTMETEGVEDAKKEKREFIERVLQSALNRLKSKNT